MHVRAYNHWVSLLNGRALSRRSRISTRAASPISARTACCSTSPRGLEDPDDRVSRPRAARGMRAGRRRSTRDRRRAEPLAAVAPDRPLSADHRQSRADRVRGRVRRHARAHHAVSRHPDAVLVGRRGDRLHLWRDQLEGGGRRRDAGDARPRSSTPRCASAPRPATVAAADVAIWADGPSADHPDDRRTPAPAGTLAGSAGHRARKRRRGPRRRHAQPRRAVPRARPRA